MSAVPAGGVAELTADAFFFVDARDDFVIEVEVFPLLHARKTFALKVSDALKTFFGHPVGEAVGHFFDDAIAIVHDGGANLNGGAAEKKQFDGVTPVGDTADAGKRKSVIG